MSPPPNNLVLLHNPVDILHLSRMPKREEYLIAYDSPDDSRRRRLLAQVQGFGVDPQYSFHISRLTRGERREMWQTLSRKANTAEDRLLMLRIGEGGEIWRFGAPREDAPSRSGTGGAGTLIWIG